MQLPVTPVNPGGIVPGTLSGVLVVDGFPISFEMYSLFPLVNKGSLLLFGNADGSSINGKVTINRGTANAKTIIVTGNVDYDSGTISLNFTDGEGGPAINPGAVSVSFASYAVYNQDAAASSFTFAPGQTFEEKVFVDLLTPGSAIAINSPIIQTALPTGKGNGELSSPQISPSTPKFRSWIISILGQQIPLGSTSWTGGSLPLERLPTRSLTSVKVFRRSLLSPVREGRVMTTAARLRFSL